MNRAHPLGSKRPSAMAVARGRSCDSNQLNFLSEGRLKAGKDDALNQLLVIDAADLINEIKESGYERTA